MKTTTQSTIELRFDFRGETYRVDVAGRINANGIGHFSDTWVFLGGTRHHWSNRITVPLSAALAQPELLNGCLGFDRDHGTTRQWGGRYSGGLPRITNAHTVRLFTATAPTPAGESETGTLGFLAPAHAFTD